MYLFDLRSPILEAFFLTASVGLPNFPAICAVGLLGNSFLSRLTSLLAHKPLTAFFLAFFFAILRPLSRFYRIFPLWDIFAILESDAAGIKLFSAPKRNFFVSFNLRRFKELCLTCMGRRIRIVTGARICEVNVTYREDSRTTDNLAL